MLKGCEGLNDGRRDIRMPYWKFSGFAVIHKDKEPQWHFAAKETLEGIETVLGNVASLVVNATLLF